MKADDYLESNETEFILLKHQPVENIEEAADARDVKKSQVVKSVLLRTQSGREVHVCVPGDREVSATVYEDHSLLSPEKTEELTGFKPGRVHPFSSNLPRIVERRLLQEEYLVFTTGQKDSAVKIEPEKFLENLKQKADLRVTEIVKPHKEEILAFTDEIGEDDARFLANNGTLLRYRNLSEFSSSKVLKLIKEEQRHEIEMDLENAIEILEKSDSSTQVQKMVEHFVKKGEPPKNKETSTEEVVERVLNEEDQALEDLREGRESAINYLMGEVMQQTAGRAEPNQVQKLIERKL